MESLEEVLNIVFQEYGGLILVLLSIILSIMLAVPFAYIIKDNVLVMEKLKELMTILKGALV